jgi:hypothetical protein
MSKNIKLNPVLDELEWREKFLTMLIYSYSYRRALRQTPALPKVLTLTASGLDSKTQERLTPESFFNQVSGDRSLLLRAFSLFTK